jgi:hypothetical protein
MDHGLAFEGEPRVVIVKGVAVEMGGVGFAMGYGWDEGRVFDAGARRVFRHEVLCAPSFRIQGSKGNQEGAEHTKLCVWLA